MESLIEAMPNLLGQFLEEAGALAFILLVGKGVLGFTTVFFYKKWRKADSACAIKVGQRAREVQREAEAELERQRAQHEAERLELQKRHSADLAELVQDYARLAQRIADIIPEWARRLDKYTEDFRRIYDLISQVTAAANANNLENVKALGQISSAFQALPFAIENTFRKLLSELENRRKTKEEP